MKTVHLLAALTLTLQLSIAHAEVVPHRLIAEGAVLQQGMKVPIWGTAKDDEKVTVEFQSQKLTTTTKDGRWIVRLKPLKPGGPFTLKIQGDNSITFTNILVGEVWICTGQSNMNFPLGQSEGAGEAIAHSGDPQLRLLWLPIRGAATPQRDFDAPLSWRESDAHSAPGFSAVAYYFGRQLRQARNVPVGLIFGGNGSMSVQPFTPAPVLAALYKEDPGLRAYQNDFDKRIREYPELLAKYEQELPELTKKHEAAVAKAKAEGQAEMPPDPKPPDNPSVAFKQPSWLYNGRFAPLQPYAIRGVIYYQGESNAIYGVPSHYRPIFSGMIRGWRADWAQGEFPFLFVQLSSCGNTAYTDSKWAELREAQLLTSRHVPHTAMVVTTDVGECKEIHPKRKEPVGARLALAARAIVYGEKIEYSGPLFDSMKINGDHATLTFQHVGGGLVAKDGDLRGFTIAGNDGKFVAAHAEIRNDKIIVWSGDVKQPAAVRYGWADCPLEINLYNKDGLPASPFRTNAR